VNLQIRRRGQPPTLTESMHGKENGKGSGGVDAYPFTHGLLVALGDGVLSWNHRGVTMFASVAFTSREVLSLFE